MTYKWIAEYLAITLTTGLDTIPGLKGDAGTTSTSGNDVISSIVNASDATKNTINAGDSINAGAGNDTLSIVSSGAGSPTVSGFFLDSVETLSLQNASTVATDLLTVNIGSNTGIQDVRVSASVSDVTVQTLPTLVSLAVVGGSSDVTLTYGTTITAATATADTQKVSLNGVSTLAGANSTITANGIETFAVTTTGSASGNTGATAAAVTLVSNTLRTVTVEGDKAASLVVDMDTFASATNTATFDASKSSAAVTAAITVSTGDKLSVKGGTAADKFTINNLASNVTVDGGAGAGDILSSTQTTLTQTDLGNVSGIEVLQLAAGSNVDVTKQAAELTTVQYTAASGASTLTGVKSGLSIVQDAGGTTLGVTVTGATTAGTADVLGVTIGKSTTTGAIAAGTLTATGVETINVTSLGTAATANTANTLTVAGTSVTTVSVAGAEKFTLTQSGGSITSYDASTAGGAQNTASISFAAAGATVKGGSAADTITTGNEVNNITGGAGNDTISAGGGNDTVDGGDGVDSITGGAAADVLTGGAGADVFVYGGAAESSVNTMDTIKDFVSGTDKISGTGATKFNGNFGDIVTGLASVTGANQAFFVTGTNTLYVDVNGSSSLNDGTDYVIKLEGVTSLAAADLTLGSQGTGNSITLTAANATANLTTNTNASAKTTNLDDTITVQASYLPVTAVVGGLGSDTLVVTDGTSANTVNLANITEVEVLDMSGTNLVNTVSGMDAAFKTIRLGTKGDTVNIAADNNGVSVAGGAGIDAITLGDYTGTNKATVEGGAGNDVITLGAVASTNALSVAGGAETADKLGITGGKTAVLTGSTLSGLEILGSNSAGSAEVVTINQSQFSMFTSFDLGGNANDRLKLSGAATYDLTTKTVTSNMEVELLTAGSTLRANAGQLGDSDAKATGSGVGSGDTLAIADNTAFDATTVTKFDTITYAGTGTTALTVKASNLKFGDDGTTAGTTGAVTITGSGTSDLTINGDANIYFTGVALTGFDAIDASAITSTGNSFVADAADLQGVTLKGAAATNLEIRIAADTTSTMVLQGASQFDTLKVNNTGSAGATLTIGSTAFNTSMISLLGTSGGQNESIAITASTATAAINLSAVATTNDLTAITVNDGTGNNTITVSSTEATAAKTTVSLANGGSDTVVINDLAHAGADANGVTINGFTTGAGTGSDVLDVQLDVTAGGQNYVGDYQIVTAAGQALTIANSTSLCVVEVNQVAAAVTNLSDVAANGLVEAALATAFGTVTNAGSKQALVILYGAGAAAGNAGIYSVDFSNGVDALAGNLTVELVGIINGVTADSFVSTNIA